MKVEVYFQVESHSRDLVLEVTEMLTRAFNERWGKRNIEMGSRDTALPVRKVRIGPFTARSLHSGAE